MARVFIGVGHGGSDPGAVAAGIKESEANLQMALGLKVELERHGVTVGTGWPRRSARPMPSARIWLLRYIIMPAAAMAGSATARPAPPMASSRSGWVKPSRRG